jgi:NADPH-dependent 2,4-dienoyl-CoA reductase/sulfur reductase-like enzyme/rhodanese-related sulfurtransferase
MNIIVIGASAAGLRVAARARRLMADANITVLEKVDFFSYGACGLPYFVSGDIDSISHLRETSDGTVRDQKYFKDIKDFDVLSPICADSIDSVKKIVSATDLKSGEKKEFPYDKLVLATGASPRTIPGLPQDNPRVSVFKTEADALAIRRELEQGKLDKAIIIGAGFIGCEMAEAFKAMWGADVDILEMGNHILPWLIDDEMAELAEQSLRDEGVNLYLGRKVENVAETDDGFRLDLGDCTIEGQRVVSAVGVTPNVALAVSAGCAIGSRGGITVDELLRTSVEDIYAAGDCIEVISKLTNNPMVLPLGSLANRQGRAIGNTLSGREQKFGPVVASAAVKLFDFNVSMTGISEAVARQAGIECAAVWGTFSDCAHYYPEEKRIKMKMVYEKGTGRLLGLQGVGAGEVVKRVDVFGNLLHNNGKLEDLLDLEFAYAPPYAGVVDPLFTLGCAAINQEQDGVNGISPNADLSGCKIIDVRLPGEIDLIPTPGSDTINIPLSEVRARLDEIPKDADVALICERGTRSSEAARMLLQYDFKKVSYVGGGTQMMVEKKDSEE